MVVQERHIMVSHKDQFLNFMQFKKDLDHSLNRPWQQRLFSLLSLALINGGLITDRNLVAYFDYLNIDVHDEQVMSEAYNLLAYYSGGQIITIVDTGLHINIDEASPAFRKGMEQDFSALREAAESIELLSQLRYHDGQEEN